MKKQLRKVIAMTLVCAMTLPTAVFASTAPSLSGNNPGSPSVSVPDHTISGNGTVDTATYNIVVPSNLDFAVDRFEVSDKGQIYGVDYPIVNGSAFAVKVDVTVSNNSTSANLVSDASSSKLTSTSASDLKSAYMAVYIPASINVTSVSLNSVSGNTISGNWASVSDNTVVAIGDAASDSAKFGFKLAKYDGSAVSQNNCATFSWTGKVNSAGTWANGDIKVKGAFKFSGLSVDAYDTLDSVSGNNLLGGGGASDPATTIRKSAPADITYDLSSYMKGVLSTITAKGTGSNTTVRTMPAAAYAYNGPTKALTIKGSTAAFVSTWPADTYTMTITFGDNSTATVNMTIK